MLNKENVTYKAKANNKAKEDDSESKHMWREMERFVDAKTVCGLVWSWGWVREWVSSGQRGHQGPGSPVSVCVCVCVCVWVCERAR